MKYVVEEFTDWSKRPAVLKEAQRLKKAKFKKLKRRQWLKTLHKKLNYQFVGSVLDNIFMKPVIKHKFNKIFGKPKLFKDSRTWRGNSSLTDEEILEIRKKMNIVPNNPKNMGGYNNGL